MASNIEKAREKIMEAMEILDYGAPEENPVYSIIPEIRQVCIEALNNTCTQAIDRPDTFSTLALVQDLAGNARAAKVRNESLEKLLEQAKSERETTTRKALVDAMSECGVDWHEALRNDEMVNIIMETCRFYRNKARELEKESEGIQGSLDALQITHNALHNASGEQIEKLQKFKDWVHKYLDDHGVPHHPPGPHGKEGCRIGDRMDWLMDEHNRLKDALIKQEHEISEVLGTAIYGKSKEGFPAWGEQTAVTLASEAASLLKTASDILDKDSDGHAALRKELEGCWERIFNDKFNQDMKTLCAVKILIQTCIGAIEGMKSYRHEADVLKKRLVNIPEVSREAGKRVIALRELLVHALSKVMPGGFSNNEGLSMESLTEMLCSYVLNNKQHTENLKEYVVNHLIKFGCINQVAREAAMQLTLRQLVSECVNYAERLHKTAYKNSSLAYPPAEANKRSDYENEKSALTNPELQKRLQENCDHYWSVCQGVGGNKYWRCQRCGLSANSDPNPRQNSRHNMVLKKVGGNYVYVCTKCNKEILSGRLDLLTDDCPATSGDAIGCATKIVS